MKIGILGTGFGAYHAKLYKDMPNVDSVIIYGRSKEKLTDIQNQISIQVTDDANDIISDKNIDLIDVCMPSSMHKEFVTATLKNGKNVFCETPVTLNMEDALTMKEAADKYEKKVFVDNFIKFEPAYRYLYEAVKNSTLGNLKTLHIKRKTPPLWGNLGLKKIVTNLMIHEFDFVTWLLDEPITIDAYGIEPKEGQAHVEAVLKYDNTIVNIQSSSMMPMSHPLTVGYEADFENGAIEFFENGYANRSESLLKSFTTRKEENIELENKNCYEEAFNHVLQCCEKDTASSLSLDQAIISLKTALKVKKLIAPSL